MDWTGIKEYVFDPLTAENALQLIETPKIDKLSVMVWPYYNHKKPISDLRIMNYQKGTKFILSDIYPKAAMSLTTIQEAWIC